MPSPNARLIAAALGSIASNQRAILVYGGFSIVLAVVAVLTRDRWVRVSGSACRGVAAKA